MVFYKMHGIGNDYVFLDVAAGRPYDVARAAQELSNRHFCVGSDGLVLIAPSLTADIKMEIYNADGSRAEMCGNALRCVAKYLYDVQCRKEDQYSIETDVGIKKIRVAAQWGTMTTAEAEMGVPQCEGDVLVDCGGVTYCATKVNVGNPHAVVLVAEMPQNIQAVGKQFQLDSKFPQGVNVEFTRVVNQNRIEVCVYERGSGVTMACGTGATAAAFATIKKGLCCSPVAVSLPGGVLDIRTANGLYYMKGGAEIAYCGEIKKEF